VAPETSSRWKRLSGFRRAVTALARQYLEVDLPDVYAALSREAKAGSLPHIKLLLELVGEYPPLSTGTNAGEIVLPADLDAVIARVVWSVKGEQAAEVDILFTFDSVNCVQVLLRAARSRSWNRGAQSQMTAMAPVVRIQPAKRKSSTSGQQLGLFQDEGSSSRITQTCQRKGRILDEPTELYHAHGARGRCARSA